MSKYKDKIKDKDLEQIAVTKKLGIKYLIAYDRDFKDLEEHFKDLKAKQKCFRNVKKNRLLWNGIIKCEGIPKINVPFNATIELAQVL